MPHTMTPLCVDKSMLLRLETPNSVLSASDPIPPVLSTGLAPDRHGEEHVSTGVGRDVDEADLALYRVWNQNRLSKQKECTREIIALVDKFAEDLKTSIERFGATTST